VGSRALTFLIADCIFTLSTELCSCKYSGWQTTNTTTKMTQKNTTACIKLIKKWRNFAHFIVTTATRSNHSLVPHFLVRSRSRIYLFVYLFSYLPDLIQITKMSTFQFDLQLAVVNITNQFPERKGDLLPFLQKQVCASLFGGHLDRTVFLNNIYF